jgi:kynurenine formamidase
MEVVDLSHNWGIHTPGWVGYAGNKLYYTRNLQTNRIVAQEIVTSLHSGTHLDGAMHGTDGDDDMASLPLTKLVHEGVIVDVSDVCKDWDVIKPEHLTRNVDIKEGDIVIVHTGFHRYYQGMAEQDLVRYFCMHPGGTAELARFFVEKRVAWWGIDAGSADHPMNTVISELRPDLAREFEARIGMSAREYFGEYEYEHHLSGRKITGDVFPMHYLAFPHGCIHAENVGGDIDQVLNQRCVIGAFPWKIEGGEACQCRIMAFFDVGGNEVRERLASTPFCTTA